MKLKLLKLISIVLIFSGGLLFAQSDLEVTNTVSPMSSTVGSTVVFTITAKNNGTVNNTLVTVTDKLPSGFQYVSSTVSAGSAYVPGTGIWNIGNLNNGSNAVLTITATVVNPGYSTNNAVISTTSGVTDPNFSNNSARATVDKDSDGDGLLDSVDLDDDNDGITDLMESGPVCASTVTTSLNTVPYPYNTPLNSSVTQSPVNIPNLISGSLNITASLTGVAQWGPAAGTMPNNTGGLQIKNNSTALVGDYIYMQPVATNTSNVGAVANTNNYATYQLDFTSPVTNFSFKSAGLNNGDTFEIYAYNGVNPIALDPSQLSNFLPANTAANWTVFDLGNALKVVGLVTTGGTDVDTNLFTTTIAGPLTRIVIRTYKNATTTPTTTSTATTGITSFVYCNQGPFLDTDGDGIPDYLDADSDNDGCPDATEGAGHLSTGSNTLPGGTNSGSSGNLGITVNENGIPTSAATSATTGQTTTLGVAAPVKIVAGTMPAATVNATTGTTVTLISNATADSATTWDGTPGFAPNYSTPGNATTGLTYSWTKDGTVIVGETSATLTLTGVTTASAGTYVVTVRHPGNYCGTFKSTVLAIAGDSDLQVTKTVDRPNASIGDIVVFTIVAKNNGPGDNTGVSVSDLLPNGFQYDTSVAPAGTTYDSATGVWTIGALTNGQSRTLQVYAKVNATGNYTNIAEISTTSGIADSNVANNKAEAAVAIVCTEPVGGATFNWNFPSGTASPVTQTLTQPASNGGFAFDIYKLDNSFNMEINGTRLAQYEMEFQSNNTPAPGINIEFADGDQYETNTGAGGIGGAIWQMTGTAANPLIRVNISPAGVISMFGSKVSGGPLFPLKFKTGISPVNSFNTIPWNTTGDNTIVVKQNVVGQTLMNGTGYGKNIIPCACYNDPNTTGTTAPTNHGITLLQRAGATNGNWPMIRNGGHTALESNTKGFVVTRMPTANLSNITNPVDGMMVYDTTDECLKIYTTDSVTPSNNAWKCFSAPACP